TSFTTLTSLDVFLGSKRSTKRSYTPLLLPTTTRTPASYLASWILYPFNSSKDTWYTKSLSNKDTRGIPRAFCTMHPLNSRVALGNTLATSWLPRTVLDPTDLATTLHTLLPFLMYMLPFDSTHTSAGI